jgi:hypothetical protein
LSLKEHPGEELGPLGVAVLREIVKGTIKVRVCGSIFGVLRNGYLTIIKDAGPDFANQLARYGFSGINKIMGLIKSLKR